MALYETTTELVQYVEFKMREKTDGTSPFRSEILKTIDLCHKLICAGGGGELNQVSAQGDGRPNRKRLIIFPWARKLDPFLLQAAVPYETGTITVTQSSASASFSSPPTTTIDNTIGSGNSGWFIRINNDYEVYKVVAHTSNAAPVTLDGGYVRSSGTYPFVLFRLDYDFGPSIMLPLFPMRCYGSGTGTSGYNVISLSTQDRSDIYFPMQEVREDPPTLAYLVKQTDAGAGQGFYFTYRFNLYPHDPLRFELNYIPVPADLDLVSSNPIIPRHHRRVVAELALYYMLEQNNDNRAASHLAIAKQLFDALVLEKDVIVQDQDIYFGHIYPNEQDQNIERILKTKDGFVL